MRTAVIGSRHFNDWERLSRIMEPFAKEISLIVSGGAIGADEMGERWAIENNIPTKIYLPDWAKWGKVAGMIRNTEIVENSDTIVAFWDMKSKGTKNSIQKAEKLGKRILIVDISKNDNSLF